MWRLQGNARFIRGCIISSSFLPRIKSFLDVLPKRTGQYFDVGLSRSWILCWGLIVIQIIAIWQFILYFTCGCIIKYSLLIVFNAVKNILKVIFNFNYGPLYFHSAPEYNVIQYNAVWLNLQGFICHFNCVCVTRLLGIPRMLN